MNLTGTKPLIFSNGYFERKLNWEDSFCVGAIYLPIKKNSIKIASPQ